MTPTLVRPTGGDIAVFEIVNALARGGDRVRLVHLPFAEARVTRLSDLPWFDFDDRVEHDFPPGLEADVLGTDVIVYTMKLIAVARGAGRHELLERLAGSQSSGVLSILFVQGYGVFAPDTEELGRRMPGPKACVGSALADQLVALGVPRRDVVHIPNGVDHTRFGLVRPIPGRPARVAMNFDPHPVKGGSVGLEAIDLLHQRTGVPATVFGTRPPDGPLPAGADFMLSPDRSTLSTTVYSSSSIFLQPSRREGFGLCAVEAMACGCALVTTANGGSADYAVNDETALVCGPNATDMVAALERLVRDEAARVRIATRGAEFVERFTWAETGDKLRALALERLGSLQ